ncbi:MAG: hypothetical protein R3C53_00925 [Pirellulaceae bacterium]
MKQVSRIAQTLGLVLCCIPVLATDPIPSETLERCMTELRAGLHSQDFWPSMHAAEAMTIAGEQQEVREFLEPRLPTETDDQRRCGLARELVRAGDLPQGAVLLEILRDLASAGRVHAAESLYKVGWQGETPAELKQAAAGSNDIRLRIMASAALAKYGQAEAQERSRAFLRKTLSQERDPSIFRAAAWVLGRIGDKEDRERIRRRLPDTRDDPLSSAFLEHALAALGDPDGIKSLLSNFNSTDPTVRAFAAEFAGETKLMQARLALIRQLDDQSLDARIRAAQALIQLHQ